MSRSRASLAVLVAALVAGLVWLAWKPGEPARGVPGSGEHSTVASPNATVAGPLLDEFAAPSEESSPAVPASGFELPASVEPFMPHLRVRA